MKKTVVGMDKFRLGTFPVLAQVSFGLGLVGLVVPLDPAMGHEQRTQTVLNIMAQATSDFDMVPPKVLERIEEDFYQKLVKLNQKFDVAIPLRCGRDFKRCFVWNSTLHKWEMADANMSRLKFTGDHVMLIAKARPKKTVEESVAA